MMFKSNTSDNIVTFNKHGLHLRWPRIWIIIIGAILILLDLIMAGMEIGHTIVDSRRSTAFGGFILFIPQLICAIFVLITAWKTRWIFLRIAIILCCIMIILSMLLIAYDILVLIDPTRCFFLSCTSAQVTYQANSTYNATITGWPLYITWPDYFQTSMNAKRIFQSIQLLCSGLFILFCLLYILTYMIYRHIQLHQQTIYTPERRTFVKEETVTSLTKHTNQIVPSNPQYNSHHLITTYTIEGRTDTPIKYNQSPAPIIVTTVIPKKSKKRTVVRARASSVNYDRLCTRCMREPRMILATNYERQNFFSHLCIDCNNELSNDHHKPYMVRTTNTRKRKP